MAPPTTHLSSFLIFSMAIVKTACERLDAWFMAVAPVVLLLEPFSSQNMVSSGVLTSFSSKPASCESKAIITLAINTQSSQNRPYNYGNIFLTKAFFWKIIERETLKRDQTTTLLQIFCELLLYSQVILKNMGVADDTF